MKFNSFRYHYVELEFDHNNVSVEDTEWFGVIFELPDVLVVEYQVISSSLLKGLWQGSADGLDVCEKYLVVSILPLMINLSSAVYR